MGYEAGKRRKLTVSAGLLELPSPGGEQGVWGELAEPTVPESLRGELMLAGDDGSYGGTRSERRLGRWSAIECLSEVLATVIGNGNPVAGPSVPSEGWEERGALDMANADAGEWSGWWLGIGKAEKRAC